MFKLDTQAARSADSKSGFIEEAGKYIGQFTRAEWMEKHETGSTGIGLTFKSTEGQEAQFYVNISYQHGQQNKGGHGLLNAIMACLKLREVADPKPIQFERWDKEAGGKVKVVAPGFADLMGKPIGLVLQMVIEKDSKNEQGRPQIYAAFEAATEKVATEVLDSSNPQPAILAKMVAAVAAKPVIDKRARGGGTPTAAMHTGAARGHDDFEDDIPFN